MHPAAGAACARTARHSVLPGRPRLPKATLGRHLEPAPMRGSGGRRPRDWPGLPGAARRCFFAFRQRGPAPPMRRPGQRWPHPGRPARPRQLPHPGERPRPTSSRWARPSATWRAVRWPHHPLSPASTHQPAARRHPTTGLASRHCLCQAMRRLRPAWQKPWGQRVLRRLSGEAGPPALGWPPAQVTARVEPTAPAQVRPQSQAPVQQQGPPRPAPAQAPPRVPADRRTR